MEEIDFKKGNGLVPAIITDIESGDVLMLGYMSKEALDKTRENGFVSFWSRSKNRLWEKGEESGNRLKVEEIYIDCDADTILVKAKLEGTAVCHTGNRSCFFTKI